jgi:hypothetical protein
MMTRAICISSCSMLLLSGLGIVGAFAADTMTGKEIILDRALGLGVSRSVLEN